MQIAVSGFSPLLSERFGDFTRYAAQADAARDVARQAAAFHAQAGALAHRLLYNSAKAPEYILMSASFHGLAGDPPGYSGGRGHEVCAQRLSDAKTKGGDPI